MRQFLGALGFSRGIYGFGLGCSPVCQQSLIRIIVPPIILPIKGNIPRHVRFRVAMLPLVAESYWVAHFAFQNFIGVLLQ